MTARSFVNLFIDLGQTMHNMSESLGGLDRAIDSAMELRDSKWFEALARAAVDWFDCGLPRVVMGHKHASVLALTRVPPELIADLRMPWSSFLIDIPSGLVHAPTPTSTIIVSGAGAEISDPYIQRVLVTTRSNQILPGAFAYMIQGNTDAPLRMSAVAEAKNLAEGDYETSDTLVSRIVLGTVLELLAHRPAMDHQRERVVHRTKRGIPTTMTFAITRDVKVDARQIVRDLSEGRSRRSPLVQTLTRGHWKRQFHGPNRAERKLIFIEPYWRGPEDAPIALRSHVISPQD